MAGTPGDRLQGLHNLVLETPLDGPSWIAPTIAIMQDLRIGSLMVAIADLRFRIYRASTNPQSAIRNH
jgi:hypothetical protein